MRTTFDINDDLLKRVMKASNAKTKKAAIVIALEEYLRNKRRASLRDMIGKYNEFALSLRDLEKMRSGS